MGELISVIDRPETTSREEAAANWIERAVKIYDSASENGDDRADIPSEMIAELEGIAGQVEVELDFLGLMWEVRKDPQTGEIIYSITMRRPYPGENNGTR